MTSAEDSAGIRPKLLLAPSAQATDASHARDLINLRATILGVHTQAGKGVLAVDVHRTATADTLTAASSESESRVELVLDADNGVQDHGSGLVQVDGVALETRLLGRRIGVPSVDLESLQLGLRSRWLLAGVGVLDGSH